MTKILLAVLVLLLLSLQFSLWQGNGSLREGMRLKQAIVQQNEEIHRLTERNHQLAAEVKALKSNPGALEERARAELGMVKKGETFFLVVEPMR